MIGSKRLEQRLRSERPVPSDAFLAQMSARVGEERVRTRALPRLRLGVALAAAVGAVVAAGWTGGLSYAAHAITQSSSSVANVIGNGVAPGPSSSASPGPSSTPSGPSSSLVSSNVAAANSEYTGAWYCYRQHSNGHYMKKQHTLGNGWVLVWGPDPNGANRACP